MATTNLPALLIEQAERHPTLVVGTVDQQITLADALRTAAGGARDLARRKLSPGSRVAIVAHSSTDYLRAWMACLLAGVPVALINPNYPPELHAQMLDNLEPDAVLTDSDDTGFAGQRPVISMDTVATWRPSDPSECVGLHAEPGDIASFMHTSGTTGVPKFCAQSHQYFLRLGAKMAEALGLIPGDRMLAPLPLFHINPLGYGIIGALTAGADALTVAKFSASGFWPTVRQHGITALALHAPPVEVLKRATSAQDAGDHQVRTMFYADAEFMSRFTITRAVSGYGSTEAAGVSHLHRWTLGQDIPPNASRYGGSPRDDVEDRLDDDGQILVRQLEPHTLFAGYFAHGAVQPTFDEDGWFHTGDLGRRDDQGGLVFIERAAESIRVKGEFVPIPYVEEQLGTIAELHDLALWKKPGELVDDEIVLYVVADDVPLERIRGVSGGLPMFMRPTTVARVARIPRDAAAGKVQRRLLAGEEVLAWTSV